MTSELLTDLSVQAFLRMRSQVLPAIRFFTATENFWKSMFVFKNSFVFECGSGCGDTSREANERGFRFAPVDMYKRDDQYEKTYISPAQILPFEEGKVYMMCRPDHSGWVYTVIEKALAAGAVAIYVGLESNFENDVGELKKHVCEKCENVGEDGESMWFFEIIK
jgi:hypothetical protein